MRWMAMPMCLMLAVSFADASAARGEEDDAFARLQAQVERDGSPRERALVAQFYKGEWQDPKARAHGGQMLRDAALAAPADPLVQWLWATTPLEASGCPGDAACADRVMAAARVEPDNAAAWGPVLYAALMAGDVEAARDALDHAARASHYAEPFAEVVGAWRELLRRHPLPDALYAKASPYGNARPLSREEADAVAAVAFAVAMVSLSPSFYRSCNARAVPSPTADVLADCLRIARLMQASSTVMQRMVGTGLQHRAGGPEQPEFRRQQLWWSSILQAMADEGRESLRYFDDLVSTGSEIDALRLALQRAGKPLAPPDDWVYVSPFVDVAAAADQAAREARAEAGEEDAPTVPARPARP